MLFLVSSLIIIAASLYLPEHIAFIAHRATFYWAGADQDLPATAISSVLSSSAIPVSTHAVHDILQEL